MAWRCGLLPLVPASTAAVHPTHWLISTQVMDLSKLSTMSMKNSKVRDMANVIVKGAGSFFPETAWKLFIVNAPFVFRSVYAVIKPLIHPVTRDKIKILGGKSSYLPEMKKAGIPLSAIPQSTSSA